MAHNEIAQNKEHLKLCLQSQNAGQWVQVLPVKSDDLGSTPETHRVLREQRVLQLVLWHPHICCVCCVLTPKYVYKFFAMLPSKS